MTTQNVARVGAGGRIVKEGQRGKDSSRASFWRGAASKAPGTQQGRRGVVAELLLFRLADEGSIRVSRQLRGCLYSLVGAAKLPGEAEDEYF